MYYHTGILRIREKIGVVRKGDHGSKYVRLSRDYAKTLCCTGLLRLIQGVQRRSRIRKETT